RYALLPQWNAVTGIQRYHPAAGQAGVDAVQADHRRTVTAHRQHREAGFVHPALLTGADIQRDQLVVLGLHHDDVTVGLRRGQHLAGNLDAPQLAAVALVQGDHRAVQRAEHDPTAAGADRSGQRLLELDLPVDLAGIAVHRYHPAIGIGGVQGQTVQGRLQVVIQLALADTDVALPAALQFDLGGEFL